MNVRELMGEWQTEVLNAVYLDGNRASDILTKSAALLGNISNEILESEVAYNKKLSHIRENEADNVSHARILANTTEEYIRMQRAKDSQKDLKELINALKYHINVCRDERRASYSQ